MLKGGALDFVEEDLWWRVWLDVATTYGCAIIYVLYMFFNLQYNVKYVCAWLCYSSSKSYFWLFAKEHSLLLLAVMNSRIRRNILSNQPPHHTLFSLGEISSHQINTEVINPGGVVFAFVGAYKIIRHRHIQQRTTHKTAHLDKHSSFFGMVDPHGVTPSE